MVRCRRTCRAEVKASAAPLSLYTLIMLIPGGEIGPALPPGNTKSGYQLTQNTVKGV